MPAQKVLCMDTRAEGGVLGPGLAFARGYAVSLLFSISRLSQCQAFATNPQTRPPNRSLPRISHVAIHHYGDVRPNVSADEGYLITLEIGRFLRLAWNIMAPFSRNRANSQLESFESQGHIEIDLAGRFFLVVIAARSCRIAQ